MTEQANTTGHLMQRWALTLSYDGSRFYGWQKQAGDLPTVQTALEQALSSIAGEQINTIVAGRTDTGVHATAQVVHFDTSVMHICLMVLLCWLRKKLHLISMPDLMLMAAIIAIYWNPHRFVPHYWLAE